MVRTPYRTTFEFLIGSRTRAALVKRLVTEPCGRVWLRDLSRGLNLGMGALQRELAAFRRLGLIEASREGGCCFYAVDTEHPLYTALRQLHETCEVLDGRVHSADVRE